MNAALLIAKKDILLLMARGGVLTQAILLGILLIFVFSLSVPVGSPLPPQPASAMFWIASAFCLVLAFSGLYALEEGADTRTGLILSPNSMQCIWLGKATAGLVMLLAAQTILFPAVIVFLNQDIGDGLLIFLPTLLLTDAGMALLGALLGAAANGNAARESLLSVIVFPLLIPILLAGIRLTEGAFGQPVPDAGHWLILCTAYDCVFGGAAFLLFPHVFGDRQ